MRSRWLVACLVVGIAGPACGGDEASSPTTTGTGGTATGAGGAGGAGGMAEGGMGGSGGCSPQPGIEPEPDWICVTNVQGKVVDEADAAVADLLVSACGPLGCEPDTTDAAGLFDIEVGFVLPANAFSLIPHGREIGKFAFYYPLDPAATGPVIDMGIIRLVGYPAPSDSLVVKSDGAGAPAQTVTNGEVTMDVPDGVQVNLDVEDVLLGDDGKRFFARKVDAAVQDEFVDPSLGAVALYALAPFDAAFELESAPGTPAKVQLTIQNTTGLPADTPVQFYQQGSFVVGSLQPALFHPVATGTVSGDGATITMDAGEGLELLTWVAIVDGS